MIEHVAYDLRPLLAILCIGAVIAALPVWWALRRADRHTPNARWRALAVFTLFLTFDLVLFGAFTRLTDSGLGCPDWPGCYGHASPMGAQAPIAASQLAMPSGPVTLQKAWIEMIHRYMATAVGAMIVALFVAAWRARPGPRRTGQRVWASLALVWVCVQGAFGALTVSMKLQPSIVTLHLLGGLILLCMLGFLVRSVGLPQAAGRVSPSPPGLSRQLVWVVLGMTWIQVALGAWVSTNYAVLACADFPTCQGVWLPPMDFSQGFEWWRPLGKTADGHNLTLAALTAIHWTHRVGALLLTLAVLALCAHMRRVGLAGRSGWGGLAALLALQLGTGLSNVVLQWPLAAAVVHTGGAAALVMFLTGLLRVTNDQVGAAAPAPVPAERPMAGGGATRLARAEGAS